ncbi:MAG: 23S rRNA (uracil(1939)-C(5))-methyltransferase RlmD [Atopobiaceae bacterium]|nr:23S rRNA (uracil(1939)-C(5))-methyltransferase RlmD [Atopobiaceae bacterium]
MGFKTYTCPIAKKCGGCEWLAVPYPIQLKRKQEAVEKLFTRIADEDGAQIESVRGMEEPRAFRFKAATPFAPGKGGRIRSGFYAAGSHRIVRCDECLVEDPRARDVLNSVARIASDLHIPAYEEDRGTGCLRHAVLRCGYATDDLLLTLVTNGPQLPREKRFVKELREAHPELSTAVQNINERRTNAILGRDCKTLYGPGIMHDKLLDCTFEIGPTSFYQTNPAQTEVLYQLALYAAQLHAGMRVLDAYCGTGTIGICAAAASNEVQVTGIEQVRGAVSCAKRNAAANGVSDRCAFIRADATQYLVKAAEADEHFDVVVMDPPRAGSTPEFLSAVASIAPERVVYVSCNAVTQARDLEILRAQGYRMELLTPVDMFPHTKHVETVCLLTRQKTKA